MIVSSISTHTGAYSLVDKDTIARNDTTEDNTASNQTTSADVEITFSQAGLDFLESSSSSNTSQSSAQIALTTMKQMVDSSQATAKALAEQKVDKLQALLRQLMQMKGQLSPKALAAEVAQLSQQLAAAVEQYGQGGGVAISGITDSGDLTADNDTSQASSDTTQDTSSGTEEADATQTTTAQQSEDTASSTQTVASQNHAGSQDDEQDFSTTVRTLASELKAMLHDAETRLKKQGTESDGDIQSAENALDTVTELLPEV